MSPFTILSWSIAIATICAAGTASAETASPFTDRAFVGRDYDDNVTALFIELTPQGAAPPRIDFITFYDTFGSVLATLQNVPVRTLPFSRWVYAAKPDLLPDGKQNRIRQAISVTFEVNAILADAALATMFDWWKLLPDRAGRLGIAGPTGSCPNCTRSYLCYCVPTVYMISVPANVTYCASTSQEACERLPDSAPNADMPH